MDNQWKLLVLLLQEIATQKKLTHQEIANDSGLQRSHVTRFFGLKYSPNMETFLKVSKAIKVNFFFEDTESKTNLNVAFEKAMEELVRRVDKLPKN
jgi:DNA-binding phage protein